MPTRRVRPSPKRRRLASRENTRTTSVILPTSDHERAMRIAYRLRWTFGQLVRDALREWLDRHESDAKGVRR